MTNPCQNNHDSMFLGQKEETYGSFSSTDANSNLPASSYSTAKVRLSEELAHSSSGISLTSLMNGEDGESHLMPIKADDSRGGDDTSTVYGSIMSELSAWLPMEIPPTVDTLSSKPPTEIIFNEENEAKVPIYLRALGFLDNPLATSPDLRLALLSNFSTSYNVVNISIALSILEKRYEGNQSICSSALIAGMVLGQLSGGAIGDALGRHLAMTIMMSLQIISSFGSACSFGLHTLRILSVWRFLLGVGCGGVYPLAATLTAESTKEQSQRGKLVALTFSMQGVGYLFVPLIGYFLILILGDESDLAWRILLGIGCIPGLILMLLRLRQRKKVGTPRLVANEHRERSSQRSSREDSSFKVNQIKRKENMMTSNSSVWKAIKKEKFLFRKLIGTALTWFLFDILFYGNTLFKRVVFTSAFGDLKYTAQSVCRDSIFISVIALPGYFVSVRNVGNNKVKTTPRYIQMQGFFIMSILFFLIGATFQKLVQIPSLLLLLYGSTFFFANYGPNSTTFMLPSMTFSVNCRSTLNGICAASGKVGALIGACLFKPASEVFGDDIVMLYCSGISIIGLLLTWLCVDSTVGQGKDHRQSQYLTKLPTVEVKKKRGKKKRMTNVRFSAPSLVDFWRDDDEDISE